MDKAGDRLSEEERRAVPTISFLDHSGTVHRATAPAGYSVMEAAIRSDVPGIVAECGGECSCATCHVVLDPAWYAVAGGPGEMEGYLLEMVPYRTATSRLSCQIELSVKLDGLVVQVPLAQRG